MSYCKKRNRFEKGNFIVLLEATGCMFNKLVFTGNMQHRISIQLYLLYLIVE